MVSGQMTDQAERDRRADLSDEEFIDGWAEAMAPAKFMRCCILRWKPSDGYRVKTGAAE